jgi:hypothetical protein
MELFVDAAGDDNASGTLEQPLGTLHKAVALCRSAPPGEMRTIHLRGGTHYLPETIALTPPDGGASGGPLTIRSYGDEKATLSGGRRLECAWKPFRDGIFVCDLPEARDGTLFFTQLFADGVRQVRARYPNVGQLPPDMAAKGTSSHAVERARRAGYVNPVDAVGGDTADPQPDRDRDMTYDCEPAKGIIFDPGAFTAKRWARPQDAVIHIFQRSYWGNMQWHIKQIDYETNTIWFGEGGQQMGAKWTTEGSAIGKGSRYYIENVFEELDAPREWYLDKTEGRLYWMPEEGIDPNAVTIEVSQLQTLVAFEGTQQDSVEDITFEQIRFAHTETTFFEQYEVPSLGDWALHRGGALRLEGTRNCTMRDCLFEGLGGNAVFANCFNRDLEVRGCTFRDVGDSGVLLVGELETTTGTQKRFPYECRVENNHFYDLGRYGKQTAAVYISRAKRITIGHNLIHDLPRAGICIGDGTWGGHVIEYNHIHDTCLETMDHGPFNAWGRDRYWSAVHGQTEMLKTRCIDMGNPKSDAMETVIMRHNFFVESRGWGLDLDDGASNYDIYNNVCVGIGMKLREGAYRTIRNNIWVNCANSPCFHVGNEDNHDRYFNNITVMSPSYQKAEHDRLFNMVATGNEIYYLVFPPVRTSWLEKIDNNCYFNDLGRFIVRVRERECRERRDIELDEWQAMGFDKDSVFGDPLFVDPANNDYRVKPESPALKVGFRNFEMNTWGLQDDFPTCWDADSASRR